ncbi:VacJ family lipoprotein [Pseudoruegeria sp. HB172150]|uniref:MlaA family lipoprotein n=1 Tax=Pseudoruegeria sp. HB172150 TaxID=2721164 RepID=UPI001551FA22|nr:VacJ family lipoprotein [Pseudoruegeria sp. HB172150]
MTATLLAACTAPEVTQTINDPYEKQNRAVHEFNKKLDTAILKPLSGAGGEGGGMVLKTVGNVAGNLDTPRMVVNDLLQANVEDAGHNFMRLLINSTFGIAGLFDPATAWGLPSRYSDFGETMHVWGASEGVYQELPLLGPSTTRDTAGRMVDLFLNPLSYAVTAPETYYIAGSKAVSTLSARGEYADSVDDVLYGSADSYAQTRLLYLQNRRFQLGQTVEAEEEDPFALDTEGF